MSFTEYIKRRLYEWKLRGNRRRILIIEDLRVGYVPIYKNASTSLRRLIRRRQAGRLPALKGRAGARARTKRQLERRIRRSVGVRGVRRLRKRYFLFAFVRNPVSRLYSCYLDKVVRPGEQGGRFRLGHCGIAPGISFEAFVRHIAGIPDSAADKHFRSQYFEICYRGECLVDFVGKLENMDIDWQRLAGITGLEERPGTARKTGAGNDLDHLPLSLEAAHMAVRRYSQDIDFFGYREEVDAWLSRKASIAAEQGSQTGNSPRDASAICQ